MSGIAVAGTAMAAMPVAAPALAVGRLGFAYRKGARPVIGQLDARFPWGSVTAVVGPSGGGKSTLLYLLALMLRPTSGTVSWQGQDLSHLPDAARSAWRARQVGFVFQDAVLDASRTVLDNVCEGAFFAGMTGPAVRQRAAHLLERAGVVARADHRPGEISGGQAQRVALCRALIKRPAVVLADEPSGNLDEGSANVVWSMLRMAARDGACVVVATHDITRAASCDQQVEMG